MINTAEAVRMGTVSNTSTENRSSYKKWIADYRDIINGIPGESGEGKTLFNKLKGLKPQGKRKTFFEKLKGD